MPITNKAPQKKSTVIFIANSLSQPRIQRRIIAFCHQGYKVKVFGYDRDSRKKDIDWCGAEVVSLGRHQSGGGYLKKLFDLICLRNRVNKSFSNSDHVLYIFGPLTMFAFLFTRFSYIYEISDLIYGRLHKSIRYLLDSLTRLAVDRSVVTVVTSKGFTKYFFGRADYHKVIYVPNKLSPKLLGLHKDVEIANPIGSSIKFAFIGSPRFVDTVFRFAKNIGEKYPQHSFCFYGTSDLEEYGVAFSDKYSNVSWKGAYFNPDDLPEIYSNVDVVISCYYSNSLGSRIAEPNKLFESIFFNKPIVVSENTHLADVVVNVLGSGFAINAYSDDAICAFVDSLTPSKIDEVLGRIALLDKSEMIDNSSCLFSEIESKIG